MGLLGGFDDPKTLGLLGMAAPLLQAGGYSQTPTSMGQALGAGLQGGMSAYAGGRQNQQMSQMNAAKLAEIERAKQEREALAGGMASFFAKPPGAPTMANGAAKSPAEAAGMSPQQIAFLQSLPPEQQASAVQAHMSQAGKQTVVPAGATVLGANGQPVYQNPRSERPAQLQGYLDIMNDPNRAPQEREMAKAAAMRLGSAPATNVTVNNPGQAQTNATEKTFSEFYTGMLSGEMSASGRLAKLDQLDGLLKNVETGRFAETRLNLSKAAEDLGMKGLADGIMKARDSAEAATALANEMALELRNPANGAGMPGAMSDSDREFLKTMIPGLAVTPEGRSNIIEFRRAMIQREKDIGKLARTYAKKNGGRIDEGFFDELSAFSDKNPIVPRPASPEAANSLKPGTMFIDPNGTVRRR